MKTNQDFLVEFESEIESTKKLIECIPTDKWDWKPHTKSMSLGDLAKHIVGLTIWSKNISSGDQLDLMVDFPPLDVQDTQGLLSLLDKYKQQVIEVYSNNTDIAWDDLWELKAGDYSIMKLPKFLANRIVVNNHIYHHRGQLSVYLRLLDVAIPGMYGPSADQN